MAAYQYFLIILLIKITLISTFAIDPTPKPDQIIHDGCYYKYKEDIYPTFILKSVNKELSCEAPNCFCDGSGKGWGDCHNCCCGMRTRKIKPTTDDITTTSIKLTKVTGQPSCEEDPCVIYQILMYMFGALALVLIFVVAYIKCLAVCRRRRSKALNRDDARTSSSAATTGGPTNDPPNGTSSSYPQDQRNGAITNGPGNASIAANGPAKGSITNGPKYETIVDNGANGSTPKQCVRLVRPSYDHYSETPNGFSERRFCGTLVLNKETKEEHSRTGMGEMSINNSFF